MKNGRVYINKTDIKRKMNLLGKVLTLISNVGKINRKLS